MLHHHLADIVAGELDRSMHEQLPEEQEGPAPDMREVNISMASASLLDCCVTTSGMSMEHAPAEGGGIAGWPDGRGVCHLRVSFLFPSTQWVVQQPCPGCSHWGHFQLYVY